MFDFNQKDLFFSKAKFIIGHVMQFVFHYHYLYFQYIEAKSKFVTKSSLCKHSIAFFNSLVPIFTKCNSYISKCRKTMTLRIVCVFRETYPYEYIFLLYVFQSVQYRNRNRESRYQIEYRNREMKLVGTGKFDP